MATITTAFDITPANKFLFLSGCILWTIVGLNWKQSSLWTLNVFCGLIYLLGIFK